MLVVFTWKKEDFEYLLRSCDKDEATPYILKYMPKSGKIVEAGCGLGRYVKYLSEKGYDIEGIELNEAAVSAVKEIDPGLNVIYGDVLNMPYGTNTVDGIISLGVVEHFIFGCDKPLEEMYRVLKHRGVAIITVPSFNMIRKIKTKLYIYEINHFLNPLRIGRRINIIRKLLKKEPIRNLHYNRKESKIYNIYPVFGDFFEYRLTKKEFEEALLKAGFTLMESVPIGHMDGIYHEFGRIFVSFRNWEFHPNIMGKVLNRLLSKIPFCHNHLHLCVVKKERPI